METYIVKIVRRREQGEEPVLAGIIEEAGTGRIEQFADSAELLALLEMKEKMIYHSHDKGKFTWQQL